MRTILVFNDGSAEAANAEEFASAIARKVKADLLVLNFVKEGKMKSSKSLVGTVVHADSGANFHEISHETPDDLNDDFKPVRWDVDASNYSEKDVAELVIRKDIWLIIKGVETQVTHELLCHVDTQSVINHVGCPLLLIPDNYKKRNFENIAYAVDMRYCRRNVLKFLTEFARNFEANLILEHLSAKGLVPLDDKYAMSLFEKEVAGLANTDRVYFNNIRERNMNVAIGIIINDLQADLLALVNHRFHFEEIFGRVIKPCMPENIPVPVMVFPL
jgi:nucleotide-binding universal stress UspA family protein